MIRWIPYSFVRIVIFFIAGTLLGIYVPARVGAQTMGWLCLILMVAYFTAIYFRKKINLGMVPGIIGMTVIFLTGYAHVFFRTASYNADHLLNTGEAVALYRATVSKPVEAKDKTWKIIAAVNTVNINHAWLPRTGNVIVYYPKKNALPPFEYGDVVLVKGRPVPISSPANPEEFDYRRFMRFKNIYHQHFVRENSVMLIGRIVPSKIMAKAYQARAWCDGTLRKYVTNAQEQAIALALVLGVNDGLDSDLMTAYAGTGTLHVLSVSGLHVSIIYLIILLLLKPLNKMRHGQAIIAVCSIVTLWGYAFITGLSPSVLRAVTMFSFVAIAKPWNRRSNIYNTLAASALILLVLDPFLIMSLGFQLSYLAVLGIVYIQPGLYALWQPGNRLFVEIWKVTTVSVAAQLATFALGLLYFHQFPTYFLISNLLVIPESFGVLVVGLGVLVFSFAAPVAGMLGAILAFIVRIMNATVFTIDAFPASHLNGISVNAFQCILLMFATAAIVLSLKQHNFTYAMTAAACIVTFSVVQWIGFSQNLRRHTLAVYSIKGHSAIDLIHSRQVYFFADTALMADTRKIDFHISPNRIVNGVAAIQAGKAALFNTAFSGCALTRRNGKNILLIREPAFDCPAHLDVDYCIIANNAVSDITYLQEKMNVKTLILDSSNTRDLSDAVVRQAKKSNLDIYDVLRDGAFITSI